MLKRNIAMIVLLCGVSHNYGMNFIGKFFPQTMNSFDERRPKINLANQNRCNNSLFQYFVTRFYGWLLKKHPELVKNSSLVK